MVELFGWFFANFDQPGFWVVVGGLALLVMWMTNGMLLPKRKKEKDFFGRVK